MVFPRSQNINSKEVFLLPSSLELEGEISPGDGTAWRAAPPGGKQVKCARSTAGPYLPGPGAGEASGRRFLFKSKSRL